MMGWCPYDGEICHYDDYCSNCPHKLKSNKTKIIHNSKRGIVNMCLIDSEALISSFQFDGDDKQWTLDDIVSHIQDFPTAKELKNDEWILCSDRLPDDEGEVLVTRHFKGVGDEFDNIPNYVETAWYDEDNETWHSYSDDYKVYTSRHEVIAWKPMPPCYEGE